MMFLYVYFMPKLKGKHYGEKCYGINQKVTQFPKNCNLLGGDGYKKGNTLKGSTSLINFHFLSDS